MTDMEERLQDTQVVVLMGGLGTRLGESAGKMPKAMVDVGGHPFFDYQLRLLISWGFKKYLFLTGYRGEAVEQYYGNGSAWGVSIQYSPDGEKQLGTGGALRHAAGYLEDVFLLIYGDSFMDIDYGEAVYRFHKGIENGARGLMTILRNHNNYDRSNVFYEGGKQFLYDKKNVIPEMQYIDYGVSLLKKECVMGYGEDISFDLVEVLTLLSKEGKLIPQVVSKRFFEIGRPESLEEFRQYASQRFEVPKKAVFLDRDGVINEIIWNEDTEQLDSPLCAEQFQYKADAMEALKLLREKGYLIFIVTNQPAAAKGKTTLEKLYDIDTWMLEDLKNKRIEVECVAICPHHPQGSARSKEAFLIKDCDCRKPKPGLIQRIMATHCIDVRESYMAGDSYTDIEAGRRAGLNTAFIGSYKCDLCARLAFQKPDLVAGSLLEFAEMLE